MTSAAPVRILRPIAISRTRHVWDITCVLAICALEVLSGFSRSKENGLFDFAAVPLVLLLSWWIDKKQRQPIGLTDEGIVFFSVFGKRKLISASKIKWLLYNANINLVSTAPCVCPALAVDLRRFSSEDQRALAIFFLRCDPGLEKYKAFVEIIGLLP